MNFSKRPATSRRSERTVRQPRASPRSPQRWKSAAAERGTVSARQPTNCTCLEVGQQGGTERRADKQSLRGSNSQLLLRSVTASIDEFVEPADFPVVSPLLIEELEITIIEYAEELFPRYPPQVFVSAAVGVVEINAQDLGTLDQRGVSATLLDPEANRLVITGAVSLVISYFASLCLSQPNLLLRNAPSCPRKGDHLIKCANIRRRSPFRLET